ncbi:MAG: GNAT family N-acetyltransferase [Imperialibacter sp.]|uniref:GNAT family N-acetyltransferase n=1 Tax=Imperialibacter sp. TaxID=2038411 RepID=UPI0032F06370
MIQFKRTTSENPDFIKLVKQLDVYVTAMDGEEHAFYAQFNQIDEIRHVVVAYDGETALGCGAIKRFDATTMEVKRMYTSPEGRGRGVASKILQELERWATDLSYEYCILETGIQYENAIRLYKKSGYTVIENYGQYANMASSICFAKQLRTQTTT